MTKKSEETNTIPAAQKPDERLIALTTLLLLGQEARHKDGIPDLCFMMVNETHKLFPYRQAILWEKTPSGRIKIKTVSGLALIDAEAPYIVWLENTIKTKLKEDPIGTTETQTTITTYDTTNFKDTDQKDLEEWNVQHIALVQMRTSTQSHDQYGLWIDRNAPFNEREQHLLAQISDSYAHALDRLLRQHKDWKTQLLSQLHLNRIKAAFAIIALIILLFPVRISVTAPAEIIATNPFIISSPVQAVIAEINVQPNDTVQKGDILLKMEDTTLRNKVTHASKALDIAQTAYTKASREAFADPKRKAELTMLHAEIQSKKLDYEYAIELLSLLSITAPRNGVIIFTDQNALRGRPVNPGERIMSLVNPTQTELLIRIPADAIIAPNKEIAAKLFLNIAPLKTLKARIKTISYEATPDPDGLLTYKLHATFKEGTPPPSIGLKGTAKLYGERTILGYQMLRRPLAAIRRTLGL